MRTPRARVAAGLATAAIAWSLVGCGADPGVVAYVGSETITQGELDEAVAGVKTTVPEGQQVAVAAVANVLIHGMLAEQIAAAKAITVTDGDRDKILATSNLAPLLAVPAAKEVAYDAATEELVAQKLGSQAYVAELQKLKVTLNPRLGTLNEQTKSIEDGSSGSLSKPLTTPAP